MLEPMVYRMGVADPKSAVEKGGRHQSKEAKHAHERSSFDVVAKVCQKTLVKAGKGMRGAEAQLQPRK